ncbi:MAG: TIGR03792 family protein [Cyanobacteria bacterium P01_D01_bin.50]
MLIELLKFRIAPENREKYIQKDAEIWTTALAKYPGFLGKELWINEDDPTELVIINRWKTNVQQKYIPSEEISAINERFNKELGFSFETVESSVYQVRKFPNYH